MTVSEKHQRLAVDGEVDVAEHVQVEAGGGDDDVGVELPAGFAAGCRFSVKRSISSVTTEALPDANALEQVAVRDEGDALPPRPVAWREMRLDVVVGAEMRAHRGEQFLLHLLRFARTCGG